MADLYTERMNVVGRSKRDMWVNNTKNSIWRRFLDSPSCFRVKMNGENRLAIIVHQSENNVKKILSMPGEYLPHGGLVDYEGNKWLITETDEHKEVYERGLMKQCNHILRWISKDGTLKEKWCIIEDGTKYLIGEKSNQLMAIGDSRMALTIGKDEDTLELQRGLRFLIDDTDSEFCAAYQITKANKLFNVYNGDGVFRFIMNEVQLTDNDNKELRIADYYNWKPPVHLDSEHVDTGETVSEIVAVASIEALNEPDDDKKGWL